jgi:hypothetical protein
MEIKAAEISSVIKDQIANFETKADVAEGWNSVKCWRWYRTCIRSRSSTSW